jgi:hypothetical protein
MARAPATTPRRRADGSMVKAEQARRAAEARVERQLAELERVRAVHQEAKRKGVPGYVRDRYGTAARAKAFWQANGWY